MRAILIDRRRRDGQAAGSAPQPSWRRARLVVLAAAAAFAIAPSTDAQAFKLKLVFPDGRPMTYGSACAGHGCLAHQRDVDQVDANGEVELPNWPRTIEYQRDGVSLDQLPAGTASGTITVDGSHATVVLPRLLAGTAPEIDAVESDLAARLNEARAAQGLPLAELNPQLSAAADLQAQWLTSSGVTVVEPDLFHVGPFDTTMSFRHGEVSLPDPDSGGEVAEGGGTVDDAITDWLGSAEHREQVLAPGPMLIGVGRSGAFLVVETHAPCAGCPDAGPGSRASALAPVAAPAPAAPPPPAPAPTSGSSATVRPVPSCGREQLAFRRLANRHGRMRLRVQTSCLRHGGRYVLTIRQGTAGRVIKASKITRAGTMTLKLRPARTVHRLRLKLKRDGHVIVARTMSLRKK
jgi:hypothetical protein